MYQAPVVHHLYLPAMNRTARWLADVRTPGLLVLAVLLFLSWRHYLERTACFDSAWFSWLMIDSGGPVSALGRYASWTAQLVPVLLIHQEAPLEAVLRSYSLCLMLMHVAVFVVAAFALRDERAAVALPLTLVTGLHLMFYYGVSELNQGLSFTMLVWVLLRRALAAERHNVLWGIALALVSTWTSFHHPVMLLPLVYLLGLEALRTGAMPKRRWWVLCTVLLGWYVLRIKLLTVSSYEDARMPALGDVFQGIVQLADLGSTQYLLSVGLKFKPFILLLAATLVLLVQRRLWWRMAWLLAWLAGTMVLILVTDRDQRSPVLLENFYPLPAMAVAVTFADLLHASAGRTRTRLQVFCTVVAALGLFQVERAHHGVSAKVEHARHLTRQLRDEGIRKAIGERSTLPWAVVYSHWAFAFETALISGIEGPAKAVTVFVDEDLHRYDVSMQEPGIFLGPTWEPRWFGTGNLRKAYFDLPSGAYVPITQRAAAGAGHPAQLSIEGPAATVLLPPTPVGYATIRLKDAAGHGLRALDADGSPVTLRVRVFPANGGPALNDDRTPLERDLPPGRTLAVGVIIGRPRAPGRYRVEVELEVAGRPTGVRTSFPAEARRFGL